MAKYHVNPDTGKPGVCKATIKCQFGDSTPHGEFDNVEEAYRWAEEANKASFGGTFNIDSIFNKKKDTLEIPEHLREIAEEVNREFNEAIKNKKPLSGYALNRRNAYVEEITNHYRMNGYETDRLYSTQDSNGINRWSAERRIEQVELIKSFLKENINDAKREGKALFAGGLGGSGKSTILSKMGLNKKEYITINPDDIKEEMAKRGMIPEIKGLTPMEASTLVHEEASEISSEIAGICMSRKVNLIYDGTMGKTKSIEKKISSLKASGYTDIDAVFASVEPSTSRERAIERYSRGINSHILGANSIGGRPLPSHVINDQKSEDAKIRSKNEEVLKTLTEMNMFNRTPRVFDNNVGGKEPVEVVYHNFINGEYPER